MQSKVSVRGQTVIPAPVREALHIQPKQKLSWRVEDGRAIVYPLPEDPIKASIGILKRLAPHSTFDDFMRERNDDRQRERELEERRFGTT